MANHQVATGTMAAALAPIVTTSAVYYDVADTLDLITTPLLKGRIFGSVAWAVDAQILNTARALFWNAFALARVADDPVNKLEDFMNIVHERIHNDELALYEMGFDEGPLTTARKLLWLRNTYHERAMQYDDKYKPLTLEEMLERERPEQVRGQSRENLRTLAEFSAEGDTDQVKVIEQMLIKQAEDQALNNFETRKLINPLIGQILRKLEPIECQFYELDTTAQRRVIEASQRAVDRTLTDLARRASPIEFAIMAREGLSTRKELSTVLTAPKFKRDET